VCRNCNANGRAGIGAGDVSLIYLPGVVAVQRGPTAGHERDPCADQRVQLWQGAETEVQLDNRRPDGSWWGLRCGRSECHCEAERSARGWLRATSVSTLDPAAGACCLHGNGRCCHDDGCMPLACGMVWGWNGTFSERLIANSGLCIGVVTRVLHWAASRPGRSRKSASRQAPDRAVAV